MPVMDTAPGPVARIDGREVLYFAGTGYLGLQGDARVIEAGCAALRSHGLHAATTRTGFGETALLQDVERLAAGFMGTESALYYASGYPGMGMLAQAGAGSVALVLADEWLHLAGQDAARLIGAPVKTFRHGDPEDLRRRLRACKGRGRVLVMCDGVSPVRGDIAPIHDYLEVLADHPEARLMIDDAHGLGVLGQNGRGSVEYAADTSGLPIALNPGFDDPPHRSVWLCGTLSKAVGGWGGMIAGSAGFIDRLRDRSNWFQGAAACPAPAAGATAEALRICRDEPELRSRLVRNVRQARIGLRGLGLELEDLPTPILCVRIGGRETMASLQRELLADSIAIAHSRNYPGVDDDGALRIAIFAMHTPDMIDELVGSLRSKL